MSDLRQVYADGRLYRCRIALRGVFLTLSAIRALREDSSVELLGMESVESGFVVEPDGVGKDEGGRMKDKYSAAWVCPRTGMAPGDWTGCERCQDWVDGGCVYALD